jgi:Sec-independent protein translocase protein TatA
MEIFGIGPLELIVILILGLIIFGPQDLEKAGKAFGRSLNKFTRSDTWRTINKTSQEIKTLPDRLMREAGMEDLEEMTKAELSQTDNMIRQAVDPGSTNTSLLGVSEKSPGLVDDKPTNSQERVRWD